jgi:hypothetical protein
MLERLELSLARPGMWTGDEDGFFGLLLEDIAFVDKRETELEELRRVHLEERGLWTETAVAGAFARIFAPWKLLRTEVASVYAELACRFGYVHPPRLTVDEWEATLVALVREVAAGDATGAEVIRRHGEFSYVVGSGVAVYVSADGRWLFLDFRDPFFHAFQALADAPLRNLRLPTPHFDDGVVFTPWGRRFALAAAGPDPGE